jgi:hemerythrin superfamily protein
MPMDPFSMLEADHRQVEGLLKSLAGSKPGPDRQTMVDQLQGALDVHMQFEEGEVYPLVVQVMDQDTEEEAEVEHDLAREGLRKLKTMVDAPGFGAAVEMVTGGITHHVEEEEGEIFPKLRKRVDKGEKERLASDLMAAKRAAGLPAIDLRSASKEDLLKAAQAAGIEGRSSMTKEQLARALQQAIG